jgi:hypothetical protein
MRKYLILMAALCVALGACQARKENRMDNSPQIEQEITALRAFTPWLGSSASEVQSMFNGAARFVQFPSNAPKRSPSPTLRKKRLIRFSRRRIIRRSWDKEITPCCYSCTTQARESAKLLA